METTDAKFGNGLYDGFNSSAEILEAIEHITGSDLLDDCDCDQSMEQGCRSETCGNPAICVWVSPTDEDEAKIRKYLDTHYPDWKNNGLLFADQDFC